MLKVLLVCLCKVMAVVSVISCFVSIPVSSGSFCKFIIFFVTII